MALTFALETPADPELLTTTRLFVASAVRLLGWEGDAVEDLKLATSEAASSLMGSGGPLRTTIVGDDAHVRVAVFGAGRPAEAEAGSLVVGLELARAIVGGLSVAERDGGTEIAFEVGTG